MVEGLPKAQRGDVNAQEQGAVMYVRAQNHMPARRREHEGEARQVQVQASHASLWFT